MRLCCDAQNMLPVNFFTALEIELPPVFTREYAAQCLGGLFTAKGLSNADSQGVGPSSKCRVGKKVLYERANFIGWLRSRLNRR